MVRVLVVLSLLTIAPLLAGCIGNGAVQPQGLPGTILGGLSPAKLTCVAGNATGNATDRICNFLTTLEKERQGNEVTIAVNPTDPNNVVAGAKDYFPASAGECVWDGFYSTHDGGKTFESHNVPGSPWLLTSDPGSFAPNALSQYWCLTDPSYAFGPDGTLYMGVMAYQGDPATGSKIGRDVIPGTPVSQGGGLNDWAFNRVTQAVAISKDGGKTVDSISVVDSGSFPVNFHDREWVAVDQRSGDIYDAWTTGLAEGNMIYRSSDKGASWGMPTFVDGIPGAQQAQELAELVPFSPGGMYIATDDKSNVFLSGCGREGPMIAASHDKAATFSPWQVFAEAKDEGMNSTFRSGMVCMVAADASDGPHHGNVYMVWSDTRNGNRDIYFKATQAHDLLGGGNGDVQALNHMANLPPLKLNDDQGSADQFFPAISVSPKGVIDVAWYDRRDSADQSAYDIYFTYSLDGGKTWSPNLRVTEKSSDPQFSHHQNGNVFIGDYMDIDSSPTCAWPVWVDTRFEKADVMTACIERPENPVN